MENEHYRVARSSFTFLKVELGLPIIILHNDHLLNTKLTSMNLIWVERGGCRKVSGHQLPSQIEQVLALCANDVAKHLVAELYFLHAWRPVELSGEIVFSSLHNQVVKL